MIRNNLFCILLVALWFIAGAICTVAEQYQESPILSSQENDSSRDLYRNISTAFTNVKLNFTNIDADSYEMGDAIKKLTGDDLLVIATDNLSPGFSQPKVVQFVAQGGKVFFRFFEPEEELC